MATSRPLYFFRGFNDSGCLDMDGLKPDVLSSVISDIYDCALQPDGWTAALTRINSLMNCAYTTISLSDPQFALPRMAAHSPWDPVKLKVLNEDYGIDGVPGLRDVIFGDIDTPQSTLNVMSESEFSATPFYRDWVAPQGLRDGCVVKFVHTRDRVGAMASITRANRDIISADERQFLGLLAPHVRRAALIGDLLDQHRVETQLFRSALDGLRTPVLLVDSAGHVVYENSAASDLLTSGPIRRIGASIGTASTMVDAGLAAAIAKATTSELDIGNHGIGLPISRPGEPPAVAYVLPLASNGLRAAFNPAVAAIFVSTTITGLPSPQEALATIYDLTPAEARVLVQVGAGQSTAAVADLYNLSENTIKTHLARVFSKTGTSRQPELVNIVAHLASPLRPT
jgi:DNA-binding CsgD family transcriptional regulator/PAS domain-containing protein